MSELWYFEVAGPRGTFSPRTSPDRPVTRTVNGTVRLKGGEGQGPRVQNIVAVPPVLQHLSLSDLSDLMPSLAK